MSWLRGCLLPLSLAAILPACSDDGVAGGDGEAASTGAAGSGPDSTADSTGGSDSDPGLTDGGSSGGDPSAGSTSGGSTGGDSTGAGTDSGSICLARCMDDADCFNGGMDFGLDCSPNGFCHAACEEPADCVPIFSGWYAQPCTSNAECISDVCVDFGEAQGGCGNVPTPELDCGMLMLDETTVMDVDGNEVVVCAEIDGLCRTDALGDMSCVLETCETAGCAEPLTCGDDGSCHCSADADCIEAELGTVCNADGFCATGCEDVADCVAEFGEPPLDGQTLSCE